MKELTALILSLNKLRTTNTMNEEEYLLYLAACKRLTEVLNAQGLDND
jgi:hypothetical protein